MYYVVVSFVDQARTFNWYTKLQHFTFYLTERSFDKTVLGELKRNYLAFTGRTCEMWGKQNGFPLQPARRSKQNAHTYEAAAPAHS